MSKLGTRFRRGFTLTEIMVVIAIILIIMITALPVVLAAFNTRKLSDATRTIQAALIAARDRAIASGQVRGLRLARSDSDPWETSTLMYVGTAEPFSVGTVNVTPASATTATVTPITPPDPHFEQVDPGKDNVLGTADDIPRVVVIPPASQIRFDFSGQLYVVTAVGPGPSATLTISPAVPSGFPTGPHRYQLFGPPVPMAQDKPVALAAGTVIDLRFSPIAAGNPFAGNPAIDVPRSRWLPNQVPLVPFNPLLPATWPKIDILFGPNGAVVGTGASSPLIHFWVGEGADKDGLRPHKLITLNTRSGAVQFYDQPAVVGTAALNYPEIYGPPEELLGVSVLP